MSGQLEIATSSTLWKWVMKHEQRQPIFYFWKQFLYLYSHHHQQHQGFGLKILSVADLPTHCAPLSFQLTDTEDTFVEHFSMTCKQSGFMFCFLFQDFPLISYIHCRTISVQIYFSPSKKIRDKICTVILKVLRFVLPLNYLQIKTSISAHARVVSLWEKEQGLGTLDWEVAWLFKFIKRLDFFSNFSL